MYGYIIRRLLMAIPTLIGVSIIIFGLVRLLPGDPAVALAGMHATPAYREQVREDMALDESLPKQYYIFMSNLAQGDLGDSAYYRRPVSDLLSERFPNTLKLTAASMLVATLLGITTGIISATKRYSLFDNFSMLIALFGVAMPVFWLALMAQLLFSVHLGWLPTTGIGTIQHLILPALTLGAASTGLITRITRSSMLEVLQQDYIRTARAKGLADRVVTYKHALKNALIPVITIMGLQFGILLGGAVITETVFAWPGIGRLLVDAILTRDYPVVQGSVLLLTFSFVIINLVVDILYSVFDPRIRYDSGKEA